MSKNTAFEFWPSNDADRQDLNEIKEVLASMGLRLGMDIPGWPPENKRSAAIRGIDVTAHEEMAKKLEQEMLG